MTEQDEITTMRELIEKHPCQAAQVVAELASEPTEWGEAMIAQLMELLIRLHPKVAGDVVLKFLRE